MRRVVFENALKRAHMKYGEVSSQIEFATLPPKNNDLFVKEE
jgi:hypothetical protein